MGAVEDFARQELEGFFRQRDEGGTFYCVACLAEQLTRRGSVAVAPAAWAAAAERAFERPGPLQVNPTGPCDVCMRPFLSIEVPQPGESAAP